VGSWELTSHQLRGLGERYKLPVRPGTKHQPPRVLMLFVFWNGLSCYGKSLTFITHASPRFGPSTARRPRFIEPLRRSFIRRRPDDRAHSRSLPIAVSSTYSEPSTSSPSAGNDTLNVSLNVSPADRSMNIAVLYSPAMPSGWHKQTIFTYFLN